MTEPHRAAAHAPAPGLLRGAAQAVSSIMFAAVFLIFMFKIGTRYLLDETPAWADEVSVVLFIWIIFWAGAFVVRQRDQITFDLAYRPAPPRLKRAMAIGRVLLIGGLFAAGLPGSLSFLLFLWRERTPVLMMREDWIYSIFVIFMASVVLQSAVSLVRLLGSGWRREI